MKTLKARAILIILAVFVGTCGILIQQGKLGGTAALSGTAELGPEPAPSGLCSNGYLNSDPSICNTDPPAQTFGGCSWPADMFWTSRIDSLPLDAQSDAKIASLTALSSGAGGATRLGPSPEFYINYATNATNVPPYVWDQSFTMDSANYPLVPGSTAGSTIVSGYTYGSIGYFGLGLYTYPAYDAHILTVNTSNCFVYEIYAVKNATTPVQAVGGWTWNMHDYRMRSGYNPLSFIVSTNGSTSADVVGFPITPFVGSHTEICGTGSCGGGGGAPVIKHAWRMGLIQNAVTPGFIAPGSHTAAGLASNDIYLGALFRVPASFDTTTCHNSSNNGLAYPDWFKPMLTSLQHYGMYFTDYSGPGGNGLLSTDADQAWGDGNPGSDNAELAGWLHCIPFTGGLELVDLKHALVNPTITGQFYEIAH